LVTLLCACYRDQPLITIVLGLVDLDHTSAQLPNLIDLGASLADDGADHIIGDENLLC